MRSVFLGTLIFSWFFSFFACETKTKSMDRCGDGFVDPGEDCDGSGLNDHTCGSLGHYNIQGALRCNANCTFDRSDCGGRCGDFVIQGDHGEECDGSELGGNTCQGLGFLGGVLKCGADCRFDTSSCSGLCGNGVLNDGEVCDGNQLGGKNCESLGYHGGQLLCSQDCQSFDEALCVSVGRCGDGIVQGSFGEECDGPNLNEHSCVSLGYHPGVLGCNDHCQFDFSGCDGVCGDGIIQNPHEECDGENLGEMTCQTMGYAFGALSCNIHCQFNDDCIPVEGVSAGGYHTCAVLGNGTAHCWGRNMDGQLGDGSSTDRLTPVPVSGLTNATAISSGSASHTCAVLGDGTARCWGSNASGKLGDGSTTKSHTPVQVSGLTNAIAISAGEYYTCAVLADGSAHCWGSNSYGQLGDGSTTERRTPVPVSGLTNATAISAGQDHSCAVLDDGTARCWGSNNNGKLGDNSTTHRLTPVAVSGLTNVLVISVGRNHTCATLDDGTARCWGANWNGQLGDGSTTNRLTPVAVSGLTNTTLVSAGQNHSCAVLDNGSAHCWGRNNYGQLGDGSTTDQLTPVAISGLTIATAISAGQNHGCAVVDTGKHIQCWGWNFSGQLGDNTFLDQHTPVYIQNP